MRLRTTALIAGLLGLVALVVGLVAQAQRPEPTVTVPADVDTAAVIVPADMLAFAGEGRYAVEGDGSLLAFSALPVDLEAWASDKAVTYVEGMPTWESLQVSVIDLVPEPSPSPSPSGEAEADASEEPTASPSPSADEPQFTSLLEGSNDLWRDSWTGTDRLSVGATDVEPGLDLVFVSEDGAPLTAVDLFISREVNDSWITPLIVWGGILTGVGFLALLFLIIDVRPVQARAEEWMAHRQRIGAGDEGPKPGSRRARRLEGAAIPAAEIAAEEDEALDADGGTGEANEEPVESAGSEAASVEARAAAESDSAAEGDAQAPSREDFLPPEQAEVEPQDEEEDR